MRDRHFRGFYWMCTYSLLKWRPVIVPPPPPPPPHIPFLYFFLSSFFNVNSKSHSPFHLKNRTQCSMKKKTISAFSVKLWRDKMMWLNCRWFCHAALLQFKACLGPLRLQKASIEAQLATPRSKSKHFITQTSPVLEGASLGEIKKEATSGRICNS